MCQDDATFLRRVDETGPGWVIREIYRLAEKNGLKYAHHCNWSRAPVESMVDISAARSLVQIMHLGRI